MAITGRQRLRAAGLTVAVAAVAFGLSIGGSQSAQSTTTEVQVLAFNDFHGNLAVNPATSSSGNVNGIPAGGAEYLTTHLKRLRAEAKAQGAQSVTVAAGDLIGASPLLSAAFHDEPTIEAMNLLGLDTSSVGNHEFDEGWQELLRMQDGGCLPDGDGQKQPELLREPGPAVHRRRLQVPVRERDVREHRDDAAQAVHDQDLQEQSEDRLH